MGHGLAGVAWAELQGSGSDVVDTGQEAHHHGFAWIGMGRGGEVGADGFLPLAERRRARVDQDVERRGSAAHKAQGCYEQERQHCGCVS